MNYELFSTEDERREAILRLRELEQSKGWQILLKALDINEQHEDKKLHTERYADVKDFYLQQDIVDHLRNLKLLPKLLIEEALREEPDEPEDDSEVYDRPPAPETNPN